MEKYECLAINGRFLEQKITGVQRFALETIKALDKLIPPESKTFLVISSKADISLVKELHNIKIKKIGKQHGIFWEQTEFARFVKKNNALGLYLCNAVPLFYPKGIVCIHDISYKNHPEFVTTQKHKIIRLWHLVQNSVSIKKSLAILTVSEFSKNEICSVYKIPKEKVSVVYNGWQHFSKEIPDKTNLDRFPFLKKNEYFYSMSSLAVHKNFKWILEAAKKNPNLTFAVAGNSDLKKYGDTLAENSALKNLHYLGYVSDDEAKLLMKNCRAFIFPSLYEGFGIPPLEALAMGATVICSNATCLPEIFQDTVHYIAPYNYNVDFDALLSEKVAPPEKALDLYSWEKTADKIHKVIKGYFYDNNGMEA